MGLGALDDLEELLGRLQRVDTGFDPELAEQHADATDGLARGLRFVGCRPVVFECFRFRVRGFGFVRFGFVHGGVGVAGFGVSAGAGSCSSIVCDCGTTGGLSCAVRGREGIEALESEVMQRRRLFDEGLVVRRVELPPRRCAGASSLGLDDPRV